MTEATTILTRAGSASSEIRTTAQKTEIQRRAVQIETRRNNAVRQANQQLTPLRRENVGTLLKYSKNAEIDSNGIRTEITANRVAECGRD